MGKPPITETEAEAAALPVEFFARPTLTVARELLGTRLCHRLPSGELRAGTIVEVEAYLGPDDQASHARLHRRGGQLVPTPRSSLMFGPVGRVYVYLIYGMHTCVNVVAHDPNLVGAVLIRALQPEPPLPPQSCRGPARLCAALAIERSHNGTPLCGPELLDLADRLFITAPAERIADAAIACGPRIGVEYAGEHALWPYRFGVRGHPSLSRPLK